MISGSPTKEPEVKFSAMDNFMKFAASLSSASEHLTKGQAGSRKQTDVKPLWHLPQEFRCKQEKPATIEYAQSFKKSSIITGNAFNWSILTSNAEPNRDPLGRYTWNSQTKVWGGKLEQEKCVWKSQCGIDGNYKFYKGDNQLPWHRKEGFEHFHDTSAHIKPVSAMF